MGKDITEQVDFIVKRFQDSQKRLDDQDDLIKDLKIKIQEVEHNQVNLENNLEHLDTFTDACVKTSQDKLLEIKKHIDVLNEEKTLLQHSDEKLKQSQDAFLNVVNNLSLHLEALKTHSTSFVEKKEAAEFRDYCTKTGRELDQFKNDCYVKLETLNKAQLDINNKINSLSDKVSEHSLFNKKHIDSLNCITSTIDKANSSFMSLIKDTQEKILALVNQRFESIPKPLIPSLEDAKNSMRQVIEPVSLDAKNAHLRSANNESRIMILEKKLDQALLMLNQIKLREGQ